MKYYVHLCASIPLCGIIWNFFLNLNPFCRLRIWSLIHSVELLVDGVDPWQLEGIRRTCVASSSVLTVWKHYILYDTYTVLCIDK